MAAPVARRRTGRDLHQLAFLGHEASHRQIIESGPANDRSGRVLAPILGISYGWWMNKHNRHYANPNKIGKDPHIESGVLSFLLSVRS